MLKRTKTLLLDTNVWIDFFLTSRPNHAYASRLIGLAYEWEISLLFAVESSKDVYYLLCQAIKSELRQSKGCLTEADALFASGYAWACIEDMRTNGVAVGADSSDLWLACKYRLRHDDLEDDLVLAAVERAKSDLFVTNDEQLLKHSWFPTLTCENALKHLELQLQLT